MVTLSSLILVYQRQWNQMKYTPSMNNVSSSFFSHLQVAHSYCGTVEYMAPEIIQGGEDGHTMVVDWWSLGVLLHELLTCESPFALVGENNSQKEVSRWVWLKLHLF